MVSKCFEFFLQLLYQHPHSQIENSGIYFFLFFQYQGHVKVPIKYLIQILATFSKQEVQKQCEHLWLAPKFHAPPFVYFPKLTQQNKIVFGDIKYNSNSSEFCNFSWRLQKRMIQQRNVFKNLEYDDNYCSHWRKDNMTQHQKMLSRKYFYTYISTSYKREENSVLLVVRGGRHINIFFLLKSPRPPPPTEISGLHLISWLEFDIDLSDDWFVIM